jgi:hypothetical protein
MGKRCQLESKKTKVKDMAEGERVGVGGKSIGVSALRRVGVAHEQCYQASKAPE